MLQITITVYSLLSKYFYATVNLLLHFEILNIGLGL